MICFKSRMVWTPLRILTDCLFFYLLSILEDFEGPIRAASPSNGSATRFGQETARRPGIQLMKISSCMMLYDVVSILHSERGIQPLRIGQRIQKIQIDDIPCATGYAACTCMWKALEYDI